MRIVLVALLVACGGGGSPDDPIDSGVPPADPNLVSVSPEDPIAPWTQVRFQFDRAVDDAVLNAIALWRIDEVDCGASPRGWTFVHCGYTLTRYLTAVRTELSAGGDELVVTPVNPFQTGRTYVWELAATTLADGTSVAAATGELKVIENPEVARRGYDPTGAVLYTGDRTFDDDHHLIRITTTDAGDDGVIGTADDKLGDTELVNDAAGRLLDERGTFNGEWTVWWLYEWTDQGQPLSRLFVDKGPDDTFETDDDGVAWGEQWKYDADGRLVRFVNGSGPSLSTWPDAIVVDPWYYVYDYDVGAYPVAENHYWIGEDGVLGTPDDVEPGPSSTPLRAEVTLDQGRPVDTTLAIQSVIRVRRRLDYDAQGRLIRVLQYRAPGPDGTWGTGDDTLDFYHDWFYDDDAREIRTLSLRYSGPNLVWFDEDDSAAQGRVERFDSDGRTTISYEVTSAGLDGVWFTSDDEFGFSQTWTYESHGSVVRYTERTPGPDGQLGTPDDNFSRYSDYEYDDAGALVTAIFYEEPGADGQWLTADDFVGWEFDYETGW